MNKFVRSEITKQTAASLKANSKDYGSILDKMTDEDWQREADRLNSDEIWVNDIYQVNIAWMKDSELWHLSVKRHDKDTIHDWRHLQQIKNELIGPENEGIELYPAESRLVDSANQYHLWVNPDPKMRVPVGWGERYVRDGEPDGEMRADRSRQRPFDKKREDEK